MITKQLRHENLEQIATRTVLHDKLNMHVLSLVKVICIPQPTKRQTFIHQFGYR